MFDDYKYLINQAPKEYFLTGTVATLKPITVKLIPTDQAIGAVLTTHVNNINVGSRVLMVKGFNQLIIVAVIGSPNFVTDFIRINRNSTQYIGTVYTDTTIQFNNTLTSVGSKLTFDSGNYGVKIGKGVKKIEANATIWVNAYAGYSHVFITDGSGNAYDQNIIEPYSSQTWRSHSLHAIIPVVENDLILSRVAFSVADNNNQVAGGYNKAVNLTVKVIEYDY